MDFLPLEKTYMPAICQTTKPLQDLEGEVALCHARTEDMLQSSLSIESALDSLITGRPIHESLLDETPTNGTSTGQRSRQGRIIISGTVATTIAAPPGVHNHLYHCHRQDYIKHHGHLQSGNRLDRHQGRT